MGRGWFFSDAQTLQSNDVWHYDRSLSEFSKSEKFPFTIERIESGDEAFPILFQRLERDGWKREGDLGNDEKVSLKHSSYSTLCLADPGWSLQPTSAHPVLRMFYRGYLVHGYTFEFVLDGFNLLDTEVDWATWDAKGDLLGAKQGAVHRYSLSALKSGVPDFSCDFEHLLPPTIEAQKADTGNRAKPCT